MRFASDASTLKEYEVIEDSAVFGRAGMGQFLPAVIVDLGGVPWIVARGIISRRLSDLHRGDTMEVSSREPTHRTDMLDWSHSSGCDLFQMVADGESTWFWIKKR